MEKTEKFFIFTLKELVVIVLLVLTVVGFFFTLGLHYGKKIGIPTQHTQMTDEAEKLSESPETLPPRETLEVGSQHEKTVSAETLKEATKEEIAHTDVKLEQAKAVALPSKKEETKIAPTFSIQLGSYPTKKEALQKVKVLSKKGVTTEIFTAEVNHETRYRVVIPNFKSKAIADQHGKELKRKHKIENFIVIK